MIFFKNNITYSFLKAKAAFAASHRTRSWSRPAIPQKNVEKKKTKVINEFKGSEAEKLITDG